VQHTIDTLDVLIVAPQPLTEAQKGEIIAKITDKTGPRTRIQIHEVADIPLTSSGKRRVTVSHIGGAGLRAPEA
jgi:F0F1-type ATP synthase delta subunit